MWTDKSGWCFRGFQTMSKYNQTKTTDDFKFHFWIWNIEKDYSQKMDGNISGHWSDPTSFGTVECICSPGEDVEKL